MKSVRNISWIPIFSFSILRLRNLNVVDDFRPGVGLLLYKERSVKFIDAFIASHELVQRREATVVSYDKDFDKLGVSRKEPNDIVR